jgi:hypothetical protein
MNNPNDRHPNAQKWTVETVTRHLNEIEKEATDGQSLFLGKALAKQGLYKHVWAYWRRTFHNNDDIIEQMLRIETILEAKILEGALKKELAANIATLTLKYNYQWTDKLPGSSSLLLNKLFGR